MTPGSTQNLRFLKKMCIAADKYLPKVKLMSTCVTYSKLLKTV